MCLLNSTILSSCMLTIYTRTGKLFSVKGQIANILGFFSHPVPAALTQLCLGTAGCKPPQTARQWKGIRDLAHRLQCDKCWSMSQFFKSFHTACGYTIYYLTNLTSKNVPQRDFQMFENIYTNRFNRAYMLSWKTRNTVNFHRKEIN